jgi:2,4-dienoyl-CoA reductase-like NADH-dependent reductase (Old Yellow Enzyme family)
MPDIRPLSELSEPREFLAYLDRVGAELPFDADVESGQSAPLARDVSFSGLTAGNRFCVLPLEGWDADVDGRPTTSTRERWRRMGEGGAKLIWAESAAVRPDGRSTPSQLLVADGTVSDLSTLRDVAVAEHERVHGDVSDLVIGLQLTHSGRMSHPAPDGVPAPVAVRRHPHMDATVGPPPDQPLLTDDELYALADDFVSAAVNAAHAGFDFVDLKACHGYLHHELLSAYDRPGEFGGSLENRTRFLRTVTAGVRTTRPDLPLALRVSAFDTVTHVADADGFGRPITDGPDRFWFGTDHSGHEIDLTEPIQLLRTLRDLDVGLVSITGSSPYSARHVQRPSRRLSDNDYEPPEDPLVGVARHVHVTAALKAAVPGLVYVGSAYSYLQQWLPNVAQAAIRRGMTDVVGLGRMHLAYNMFPTDVVDGRPLRTELMQHAF